MSDIDTIIAEKFNPNATPLLPFGVNNSSVRALDAKRSENKRRFILAALLEGERINLTRYVDTAPPEEPVDLAAELRKLEQLQRARDAAEARVREHLIELGLLKN